jgi:diaminopimelate epimerase
MRYAKGHGTENDFVVLPDLDDRLDLGPELVRRLCDRRAGIGADGVLRVVRARANGTGGAAVPSWFMDYRNADGSVAEMCGNGVRVFARYLIDHDLAAGPEIAIATRAGTRVVRQVDGGLFEVQMGPARVGGASWAVIGGRRYDGLAIDVGNPHLACVVDRPVSEFDLSRPPEVDPAAFPDGANVEVVLLTGERAVRMRVHERGSGETLSCGTGAVAAAVAAAVATGNWPDGSVPWTVDVPGGRLTVTAGQAASSLTGPAVIVAEGEIVDSWLATTSVA